MERTIGAPYLILSCVVTARARIIPSRVLVRLKPDPQEEIRFSSLWWVRIVVASASGTSNLPVGSASTEQMFNERRTARFALSSEDELRRQRICVDPGLRRDDELLCPPPVNVQRQTKCRMRLLNREDGLRCSVSAWIAAYVRMTSCCPHAQHVVPRRLFNLGSIVAPEPLLQRADPQ